MNSLWVLVLTLALVTAVPEPEDRVAEQDDHLDFAVADLDADETMKDLRRFLFTSNGHDKKVSSCAPSAAMKVGDDFRLDAIFESYSDSECKLLRSRSVFEMNVCRKLPEKPRLDETEEAYQAQLLKWPEDQETNAPRYFAIIDVSKQCGGGEHAIAIALFNSEDCNDEVPLKVTPLYEPFVQDKCTGSPVGPLKVAIRQMCTELRAATLDVRVAVYSDPNCKNPFHEFSFENRVWPTYYRDIKYGCHAQYDASSSGTSIAKSFKYSAVIEDGQLERVKIESHMGNDRCEGPGKEQIFEPGSCTKYNLLPSQLTAYGHSLAQNVYITVNTQSSLRFKRWYFETSDEHLRLMQQLARRKKVQEERARDLAIAANITLPQTAAATPTSDSAVAKGGKKTVARPTTAPDANSNREASASTGVSNVAGSTMAPGTNNNREASASASTGVSNVAGSTMTPDANNNREASATASTGVSNVAMQSAGPKESGRKCKICKGGPGKLLKLLKQHFAGMPNRRVSWEEFLDFMKVTERPSKPLPVFLRHAGEDHKVEVAPFKEVLEAEVKRLRKKLGMPMLRKN